jgi:DNA polymerase-3 subunit beta
MKLSATREAFLEPLQAVIGVVERRQTMPILANVLISAQDGLPEPRFQSVNPER